jgi:hypothetical protein
VLQFTAWTEFPDGSVESKGFSELKKQMSVFGEAEVSINFQGGVL